jgi:hypothetical protein
MYTNSEFGVRNVERDDFVRGRIVRDWDSNIDAVRDGLNNVSDVLNVTIGAPPVVITKTMYTSADDDTKVTNVKFCLRPSKRAQLYLPELKKDFTLYASENFYTELVDVINTWLTTYDDYVRIFENIDELNDEFNLAFNSGEYPFKVNFTFGFNGLIEDITDTGILIGLSYDAVRHLSEIHLFIQNFDALRDSYRDKIKDLLGSLIHPYDIVKNKGVVSRDLGIFDRRSIKSLLRQTVNRKIEFKTSGVGYYENDKTFALVCKTPVTKDRFNALKEEFPESDNIAYVKSEKDAKAKKAKGAEDAEAIYGVVWEYKLSPFNVDTFESVALPIKNIINKK